jgi:glycosyltransferase involved in cell wall biosynthesis
MRAGLPVVALDVWGNADLVSHGEDGLLVKAPEHVPYLTPTGAPNWSHDEAFVSAVEHDTGRVVADLVDALERLAKDPATRRRMGEAARRKVVSGRLSISARNAALRRIYEEAARR